ncbi:hypothetical protein SLA2020_035420 [Shorea laevis]
MILHYAARERYCQAASAPYVIGGAAICQSVGGGSEVETEGRNRSSLYNHRFVLPMSPRRALNVVLLRTEATRGSCVE